MQVRLEVLNKQCYTTLERAYRPGTVKNYKSRIKSYFKFCQYYCLQPLLADEWQLIRYIRFLANGVTSYNTVASYLSTIKRMHELGEFSYPETVFLLKLELMAIKRELAHVIKKAPPVTPEILVDIFRHVNIKDQQEVTAFAALVIGFTLFFKEK